MSNVRHLDQAIANLDDFIAVKRIMTQIEKVGSAVDQGKNLADLLLNSTIHQALWQAFGEEQFDGGLQFLCKIVLEDRVHGSRSVRTAIEGPKKIDFLYRAMGGWNQFDTTLVFHFPEQVSPRSLLVINPLNADHWSRLDQIPAGSLITIYLKSKNQKAAGQTEEELAVDRMLEIFEAVQDRSDRYEKDPLPVIQLKKMPETKSAPAPVKMVPKNGNGHTASVPAKRPATPAPSRVPSIRRSPFQTPMAVSGPPVANLRVVINKMDTFVHAGNAQLIVSHIRDYPGQIKMFVLRAEKEEVPLDTDSIWGKEIRNGETVLYEFFGPHPDEGFVKELAKKTNKYTQMDKVANE